MAATERRMNRIAEQIRAVQDQMAEHDPTDYSGLAELTGQMQALQDRNEELEHRWLELSEVVD